MAERWRPDDRTVEVGRLGRARNGCEVEAKVRPSEWGHGRLLVGRSSKRTDVGSWTNIEANGRFLWRTGVEDLSDVAPSGWTLGAGRTLKRTDDSCGGRVLKTCRT
ncbi:hypothetical protein LR48_Vigan01g180900 [Vigna angularis]|uniref:Uncharacterized protein n=1 Tax=Phaseolus angularis TaxID=3914 RepID=A0A0L9TNU3_PHAAN|nr:hypothetical protein LR48_Vigan01g180900 [Vigna angularis]